MPDLAAGAGITLTKESLAGVLRISSDVVSGRRVEATYADLAAITDQPEGTVAEVPIDDAGTHTDPVVGGTVDNSGVYRWSDSPAGWERIADTDALSAAASAAAAAASETAALSATILGIGSADPTNSGFDTFTASNRNTFSYSEAGAGTNNVILSIPNRAAGSVLTVLYIPNGHTGGTPFLRTRHTDATLSSSVLFANATTPQFLSITVPVGKTANAIFFGITGVTSGSAMIAIQDGDKPGAILSALQGSGFRGGLWQLFSSLFGVLGTSSVSDQQLKDWTSAESYETTAVTWVGGIVSTATVKWPDGSGGTFTKTASDAYGVTAYTISHTLSGKTVTQSAITRDGNGNVTVKPALTVA